MARQDIIRRDNLSLEYYLQGYNVVGISSACKHIFKKCILVLGPFFTHTVITFQFFVIQSFCLCIFSYIIVICPFFGLSDSLSFNYFVPMVTACPCLHMNNSFWFLCNFLGYMKLHLLFHHFKAQYQFLAKTIRPVD